jgi:BirA family biotin operon repressor/biotin-[acetyl-CoA-carboxylase] ligase
MDVLAELAASGAPHGTVVIAEEQTAGRGRAGRTWHAPPGRALLMSVLMRPALPIDALSAFPLVAGLAIAEGLESIAGSALPAAVQVKWPNDLLIAGKKICGILMQTRSSGSGIDYLNLGCGINVNTRQAELPSGSTSLFIETNREWTLSDIEDAVLAALERRYEKFVVDGGVSGLAAWASRAAYLNEDVALEEHGEFIEGRFVGVSPGGALRLATHTGIREIVSGDLTRGPRLTNP